MKVESLAHYQRMYGPTHGKVVYETYKDFDKNWERLLENCKARVLEGSQSRCEKIGLDRQLEARYPGLNAAEGCKQAQKARVWSFAGEISYLAGSPGFRQSPGKTRDEMAALARKGPASAKYKQLIEAHRKGPPPPVKGTEGERMFHPNAEEQIRDAMKAKYKRKMDRVWTQVFVEKVYKPATEIPKEGRQFAASRLDRAVDAALAEFDFCVKKNWGKR